ncbi:MAG: mercuric ion transporter MerT [Edaphobacter sp.]
MLREKSSFGALLAGGVAAVLASTCCLGPLVLVLLGFSGAWIGSLSVLEPYRPFFLVLTFVALAFAGVRIFRPAQECAPGEFCSIPRVRRYQRIVFMAIALLALLAFVFPYLARFFY